MKQEVLKGLREIEAGLGVLLDIKKIRKEALARIRRGDIKVKDSVKP